MPLLHQHAERARDQHLATGARRLELAPHDRQPLVGWEHVDPGRRHHRRDRAPARHPDVAPRRPVDRDAARAGAGRAETGDALAEQVVGGAVVGLARVAEATRDGAEHHRGAELGVTERVQEMEPTVGLHVEDQVVLGLRLVGQLMAHLDTRGVHEHVDVIVRGTHRVDHRGNGRGVGEVDLVPACGTACCLHRVDRLTRGGGPLETAQLPLDERRRRALPACLDPLGQVALEAVAVGVEALEVGIAGVGLGGEVEKMERAGRRGRQVGDDRGDDAAGRTGHHEHGIRGERARRVSLCRLLVEAHTPSVAVGVPDLDRAGVGRGLGHQGVGECGGLAARRDIDRFDQGIGPLAASAFVKPVTAPPIGSRAPSRS